MTFGFCSINGVGPGVLSEHGVASLATLPGFPAESRVGTVRELLAHWNSWCEIVEGAERSGDLVRLSQPAETVHLLPPIGDPPTIYCAAANYYDHAREMGTPMPDKADLSTFHFLTAPAALTGHRSRVRRPNGCSLLDWEVELVAVVGSRAWQIDTSEAGRYIAGYTVANDISARDYATSNSGLGIDWLRHKSFATLTPIGPAIVPREHLSDVSYLTLTLSVNGQMKQSSSIDQMIFSVEEQVAALSQVAPLLPGDLILTGTPAGTGAAHGHYLEPGDVVVAEIEGIGQLENTIA